MLQLDNSDEQAAQVRRELDSRLSSADEMTKVHLRALLLITHIHIALLVISTVTQVRQNAEISKYCH